MNHIQGKYNIKAVSNLVGITTHTLRAWERRYGMVEPRRTESGHRLYTEKDVASLRWLKEQVEKGLHISKAVELLKEEGLRPSSALPPKPVLLSGQDIYIEQPQVRAKQQELLHALLSFNEPEVHRVLDVCLSMWDAEAVLHDMMIPVLIEIGDRWERGEISVAHEHYASQLLNQRIQQFFRHTRVNPSMPRVVTMAGPGEDHVVGIALFSLFLRQRGLDVYFLGANTPGEGIHTVIPHVRPHAVCLSVTTEENIPKLTKSVHELHNTFPDLTIGVGGQATELPSFPDELSSYKIGTTRDDWEMWLSRLLDLLHYS